jgi:glycerophosphoryl diester phosphodiesterase
MSGIDKDSWLLTRPIAHRGLHNSEFPENSIPAFERAVEKGYPIEFDVHVARDDTLFVFHDDNMLRMTGVHQSSDEMTFGSLKKLKLKDTNYGVPVLRDVLSLISGNVPILVEIKNNGIPGVLEEKLHRRLREYREDTGGEVALQSFNPLSIHRMKQLDEGYIAGQLSQLFDKDQYTAFHRHMLKKFRMNVLTKPDFISYDIGVLPKPWVSALRQEGMPVLGWTVRDELDRQYANRYCDNIIFENIEP